MAVDPTQVRAMLAKAQDQKQSQGGGSASQIVQQINTLLSQLGEMMQSSPAVEDEDKAELQNVIDHYQSFVENNLGSGQQQNEQKQSPYGQPVPIGGTPVSPEAGANPNAKPM